MRKKKRSIKMFFVTNVMDQSASKFEKIKKQNID